MKKQAELIYDSLSGNLIVPVPGVPNAFGPESECGALYGEVLAAYERLRERLGAGEEDEDVEIIIDSFLRMQRILCVEMYCLGEGGKGGGADR